MQLTKQLSLIVPVHLNGVQPELRLGDVVFHAKKEHHVTVFGFPTGKVLRKALAVEPDLGKRIDELAASFDWGVSLVPDFHRLVRPPRPNGPALETVIVRANARLDAFFEAVRGLLTPRSSEPGPVQDFGNVLAVVPPAHVTLYTTDAEGLAGIGLNTPAELDQALEAGRAGGTGDGSKLAAFPLAPGEVPTPVLRA